MKLLKYAFEQTPTLFQNLASFRTRRMGKGYNQDLACEEWFPATGRRLRLGRKPGPLCYQSFETPQALSEVETALLSWAACGPNGTITADVGLNHNLSTILCVAGRTVPGPCNDSSLNLIIVNDDGTFLYKPTLFREKPVEIETEEDYEKILKWYREGLIQLSKDRVDLDPYSAYPQMAPWNWNVNKPGSTWFIPVYDFSREAINMILSGIEYSHFLFVDDESCQPAGLTDWARPGRCEIPVKVKAYEETILHFEDYAVGMLAQNLRLASEAIGLGAWNMGGVSEDVLLGGIPGLAKGLGFTFSQINGERNYVGLKGILEGYGLPAPWNETPEALVDRVINDRYNGDGVFFGKGCRWGEIEEAPFLADARDAVRRHSAIRVADWVRDAAKSHLSYLFDKYGRYPVNFSAYHCNFSVQVHHVDLHYYEKYHSRSYITDRIVEHDEKWHQMG